MSRVLYTGPRRGRCGSGGKSCRLAVGGLQVRSHPGRVEVSLSETPNPRLLLTSWLVPCMAANRRWCVNVCVNVCVNGRMRGINCTAFWIKALYKCTAFWIKALYKCTALWIKALYKCTALWIKALYKCTVLWIKALYKCSPFITSISALECPVKATTYLHDCSND